LYYDIVADLRRRRPLRYDRRQSLVGDNHLLATKNPKML
jgi:hypothetical protein